MNGDGRDELLLFSEGRFWAWDGELKDVWSWRTTLKEIDAILHGAKGRPSEVVLSQAFALDGATGRPRWAGKGLPAHDAEESPRILEGLRDRDGSRGVPLLITNALGATVCREAVRMDEGRKVASVRGGDREAGACFGGPAVVEALAVGGGAQGAAWSVGVFDGGGACGG